MTDDLADTTPTADEIAAALDVLERAGWEVRSDRTYGDLIPGTGIVAIRYRLTSADPPVTAYTRTVAQQPWTEEAP